MSDNRRSPTSTPRSGGNGPATRSTTRGARARARADPRASLTPRSPRAPAGLAVRGPAAAAGHRQNHHLVGQKVRHPVVGTYFVVAVAVAAVVVGH